MCINQVDYTHFLRGNQVLRVTATWTKPIRRIGTSLTRTGPVVDEGTSRRSAGWTGYPSSDPVGENSRLCTA